MHHETFWTSGRSSSVSKFAAVALAAALAGLAFPATAFGRATEVATVFSRTFHGYQREHLPDNSLKPETITFAPGGKLPGFFADHSIDDLPFMKIVRTIAGPLRSQKYVTATDPNHTDLIIFVYWGTTMGAEDGNYSNTAGTLQTVLSAANSGGLPPQTANALPPMAGMAGTQGALGAAMRGEMETAMLQLQVENEQRDMNNWRNAKILGYAEALNNAMEIPWLGTSQDVVQEVEMNRYFVILRAYDFKELWKNKHKKALWETVYSISEHGNRFDQQLANMTVTAAPYFGQSKGLVREIVPEGHVQIGAAEEVPQSKR